MDNVPIEKIQIPGPTLASLLHRFSSSEGSIHGLLFGHVAASTPATLSDEPSSSDAPPPPPPPMLTATITSFLSVPSHLPLPFPDPPSSTIAVIGWFSGRRRTPLRPSMKEYATTRSLCSDASLYFSAPTLTLAPSLFLLLTTPLHDQLIHTHEYLAHQYRIPTNSFEARSLSVVNIGPSFRSNYGSFSPNAVFPMVPCNLRSPNAMSVDGEKVETLGDLKNAQKELNLVAEGFEVGRLNQIIGQESGAYTSELDDLYLKMLAKLDSLAKLVESSSAKVREQESKNQKLRLKVAGLE